MPEILRSRAQSTAAPVGKTVSQPARKQHLVLTALFVLIDERVSEIVLFVFLGCEKYKIFDFFPMITIVALCKHDGLFGKSSATKVGIVPRIEYVILAVVLSIPCVGGEGSILNGIYNAFCIIVIFPLIVMIGAGSVINGAKGNRICDFLGQISYPLYITHYPLMYVQMCWVYSHPDAPLFAHLTMNIGVVVLSVFIAWAALKLYDIPLRAWLKDRLW